MDASHREQQHRESEPLKRKELEKLYSISEQLKDGIEHISTGQVEIGRVWIQVAYRDLNIMITNMEFENGKGSPDNE